MKADFIFDVSPVPSVHASTLSEKPGGGLIAAWFGGSFEGHDDVGIWLAEKPSGCARWSEPRLVADGVQGDGKRFSCWNPVLHRGSDGILSLFYKVGASPRRWWGMVTRSADGGRTWDPPERLADGILGPIKNKPVEMACGLIISPSSSEHDGWRVHLEYSHDGGRTWRAGKPLNSRRDFAAIQPCILAYPGELQLLCRSRQGVVIECRSKDGVHWSKMRPTALPNPDSGIDAVVLADGRGLLVYNHSTRKRTPLNVAVSRDRGRTWVPMLVLERDAGEFSYPAVIVDAAGMVHISYTWNRQTIRHVTVDPRELCRLAC
ncbi:MAG TPA: sialidase family protein [Rhodospirillales bacterium]|nr:sialidase family protein [Rhodospirillales bacterium]